MKLRHGVGFCVAGTLAVAASPAFAQDPAPAPTTPPPPATQPAAPPPPAAKLRLALQHVRSGRVLAGDRWLVRGTVRPYAAGQSAVGFCVAGTLAVAASPAFAQDPAPTPTTPPPPATQPAAPAPPAAKLRLALQHVRGGRVLAGDRWLVRGTVRPYAAGQSAVVRLYVRGRKVAARAVRISRAGTAGRFSVHFRRRGPGRITVRASHRATPELGTAVARPVHVTVLARRAAPGSRGLVVRRLQARLARLGYVVGRRGLYDDRTARAVLAFRKLTGMARTSFAGEEVFRRLARGQGAFRVRYGSHGRHVEADIRRQVLALIDAGGRVERIYPISSGKSSTPTVLGHFRVYLKSAGINAKGMVDSSYFIRGYAIHGYYTVPPFPASHGCLRVPVPDAASIFSWVRYGTPVDTYYG